MPRRQQGHGNEARAGLIEVERIETKPQHLMWEYARRPRAAHGAMALVSEV